MKKLFFFLMLINIGAKAQTITDSTVRAYINTALADNNVRAITPALLRSTLYEIINLINRKGYNDSLNHKLGLKADKTYTDTQIATKLSKTGGVMSGAFGLNVNAPGELFHLGDGNMLLEGGGEVAQKFKRDFTTAGSRDGVPTGSGQSVNPIFSVGRIIEAGDGDPEIRYMYSDDNTIEKTVFEVDRKGIVASVKTGRGSHYEGFISLTDVNPTFRLNSYPSMRLEMGPGANGITDVAVERGGSTGSLNFYTNSTQKATILANGNLGIGINTPTSKLQVIGLQTFADNASAVAGGLTEGAFYRTSTGVLMVVF